MCKVSKFAAFVIIVAMVFSSLAVILPAAPVNAATTWYVNPPGGADGEGSDAGDGKYTNPWKTIQHAIDDCGVMDGDTIIVMDGTSVENVNVTKELTIRSQNGRSSTTVKAAALDHDVFHIPGYDHVTISGFKIQSADSANVTDYSGIYLEDADYCKILNNEIIGNDDGIYLSTSYNNEISGNLIHDNWYSCPFVYSWDGQEYVFDSHIIPTAARHIRESMDYDNLESLKPVNGVYKLKVTEELFETSYVNELKLVVVDHPLGTTVIPDIQGNMHTLRSPYTPVSAEEKNGAGCLDKIKEIDKTYWTSNLGNKDFNQEEDLNDSMILEFEKPREAQIAKIMVSFKDTRLAERITYGVTRLPTDSPRQRSMLLNSLRQLRLEVWDGAQWVSEGSFLQPGPFMGRNSIKLVDISGIDGDRVKIKLEAVTGAVLVDAVQMDYSADEAVISTQLSAAAAVKADGMDIAPEILSDDDKYLALEQGDFAYVDFLELAANPGYDRSYIVIAKGYYDSPLLEIVEGKEYEDLLNEFLADFSCAASYYLKLYASGVEHCGINLHGSSNNTISANEIYDNYPEEGIFLQDSNNNLITKNCIHDNGHGIWLYHADNNEITFNGIFDNFREGISLPNISAGIRNGLESSGNVINFNSIYGNSINEPDFGAANENPAEELDAENNWWGANNGPAPLGDGDKVSDGVDYDPWLLFSISADPASIGTGGETSTILACFCSNSNGKDFTNGHTLGCETLVFTTSAGTLGSQEITEDGKARVILTSGDDAETATVCAEAPHGEAVPEAQYEACMDVEFKAPVVRKPKPFLDDGAASPSMSTQTWARPADTKVLTASVQPAQVAAGQPVTIMANVANRGDLSGSFTAQLSINGQLESTQKVAVPGNGALPVKFTVTKDEPGIYTVDVNGQKAYFTVIGTQGSVNPTTMIYTILGILVVVALILGILFFLRRGYSR